MLERLQVVLRGCVGESALCLALSMVACDQTNPSCYSSTSLSQAIWMCINSAAGFWLLDMEEVHLISTAEAGRLVVNDPMDSGILQYYYYYYYYYYKFLIIIICKR